jgi:hypothetical protein
MCFFKESATSILCLELVGTLLVIKKISNDLRVVLLHREALHASARLAESKSSLLVSSNSATKTATPAAKPAASAAAADAAEVTHTLFYAQFTG